MLLMECPQYIWKEEALHLSSAIQSCPTLSYPMDCTPGFPVHQQHLGLVQIHIHGVGDAIQPCHLALTFGVWECAAGPLPCVPNYMHLECVSSLSWTLCCRIDWWDWVWLSQDMTHAEYAMVFAIGPLFIHSLMTNSRWFWLYIHFWFRPTPWLLWHMVFSRPKFQGLIPHQDQSTLGRENFGTVKDLYP